MKKNMVNISQGEDGLIPIPSSLDFGRTGDNSPKISKTENAHYTIFSDPSRG